MPFRSGSQQCTCCIQPAYVVFLNIFTSNKLTTLKYLDRAREMLSVKCLHCKHGDEFNTENEDVTTLRYGWGGFYYIYVRESAARVQTELGQERAGGGEKRGGGGGTRKREGQEIGPGAK